LRTHLVGDVAAVAIKAAWANAARLRSASHQDGGGIIGIGSNADGEEGGNDEGESGETHGGLDVREVVVGVVDVVGESAGQ
jgi:hypothetical protein